jgi:hypothetical protein
LTHVRLSLFLLPLVLVAACTGGSGSASSTPTEDDGCGGASPAPGCVSSSPTKVPYPSDAAKLPALALPTAQAGELGRKDNNADPSLRSATLAVTVPAGKYVSSQVVCQGRGDVQLTTVPDSQASQTINCDGNDTPSELTVFAEKPEKVAKRYVFTLRATGPSRWFFAAIGRSA